MAGQRKPNRGTRNGRAGRHPLSIMSPVPITRVEFKHGLLAERVRINREATLPIEYEQCEKTGRLGAWNLTWRKGDPDPPHIFWDSDVAKWVEAAAYSLAAAPDPDLEARLDALIDRMAAAQQADGYLNVHFTVVAPELRWTNLRDWHELYCAGHLMEAAVAYREATGKDKLLNVLCRYADYIATVFGRGKGRKRGYPGHEEIELALVKLYRATGEERYLKLAAFFVDERGRAPHYFAREARRRGEKGEQIRARAYEYNQYHVPVREQTDVVGHAVRAMYLYCGMADVAAETGDRTLIRACRRLWTSVTAKRMYVTGGIGPSCRNEGFTIDYDLPNETAYAETCAAIGLVFWAHRMLRIEADSAYADVLERALYNGVLSGVSLDGTRFFYANPLASYPTDGRNSPDCVPRIVPRRQAWFGCACCPPNLARLLASMGTYMYSTSGGTAWIHLYAGSSVALRLGSREVCLEQETDYPWEGTVRITVTPDKPGVFTIALRVPGWCRKAKIKVNGEALDVSAVTRNGYAKIRRGWEPGDRIRLRLAMPAQRIRCHPSVRQNGGRVALRRGPVVYCLEEIDNGKDLNALVLPEKAKLRIKRKKRLLGGVPVIQARARRDSTAGWEGDLYRTGAADRGESVDLRAIPYFAWANRGEGEMLVWIREACV